MSTLYPNAIDGQAQIPEIVDNVTDVDAASVNPIRSAVLAIEAELGLVPSGTYATVRARLDALEDNIGTGVGVGALETRVTNLEAAVNGLSFPSLVGNQFSVLMEDPIGTLVFQQVDASMITSLDELDLVTDQNISAGDLLVINSSGNVTFANASTGNTNDARVIGVSSAVYTSGNTATLFTRFGTLIPINFIAAPSAISNGSPVYLSSTNGRATLTPPDSSGDVVFEIGILQGANGASTNPEVLFQPRLVSEIR